MGQSEPTGDDVRETQALLSSRGLAVPAGRVEEQVVASAVSALRRSAVEGAVVDGELRDAHDRLVDSQLRHRVPGLAASLAEALLARGVVPDAEDHGGEWWLWWPKAGRGMCQGCGRERSLTRYSARWGKPYRYLCARCRKDEVAADKEEVNRVTGVVPEPGESPDSLFARRLAAEPTPQEWSGHVDRLEEVLGPLAWAGWELPESYDSEFDADAGPMLYGEIRRTCMMIWVEYEPDAGVLRLLPFEDVAGDGDVWGMLEEDLVVEVGGDPAAGAAVLAERARALGLLDATRVRFEGGAGAEAAAEQFLALYMRWIVEAAGEYRQIPVEELAGELDDDESFTLHFRYLLAHAAGTLPDLVPDAVALGIAAWCWRNDTAVEARHLPSDVLMARVNIAATRAVQALVDPVEGVDWDGVEAALTDPGWALPGGERVAQLFGEGWTDVCATVTERVRDWKRIDEQLIGPEATLRLLTIGGSTGYTRHWWGQGRWAAICRAIVTDAVEGGITLPTPYNRSGLDRLLRDLADPDLLSDEVLGWLIDMPDGGTDGPRGLRFHYATRPVVRTLVLEDWA